MAGRSRRGDPHTSHAAGESLPGEIIRKQFAEILRVIKTYGPGTMHAISHRSALRLDQIHKRLPEMETIGLVYRPGDMAPGPSNRQCMIWHLKLDKDGGLVPTSPSLQPSLLDETADKDNETADKDAA